MAQIGEVDDDDVQLAEGQRVASDQVVVAGQSEDQSGGLLVGLSLQDGLQSRRLEGPLE